MPHAFDSVALQTMPLGRFDLDERYQQEFWNPDILASTNWLDNSMVESQNYALSLQAYSAPLPAPTSLGQPQAGETPIDRAQINDDVRTPDPVQSGLPDSGENEESTNGAFYVDGLRGRQPWTRKRKVSSLGNAVPGYAASSNQTIFNLETLTPLPHPKSRILLVAGCYESLLTAYEHFCVNSGETWSAFQPAPFLSITNLETLIGIFFDRCSSATPILHSSCVESSSLHWSLMLATATLGAQCIKNESSPGFAALLCEFHRRVMQSFEEKRLLDQIPNPAQRMSVILMNLVCNEYRGIEASLDSVCNRQRVLRAIFYEASHEVSIRPHNTDQVIDDTSWQTWRDREWCIRLAYFAWQMDCMLVYHADTRPLLRLSDATIPLPCHERLWSARNAETWLAVGREQPKFLIPSPTLVEAAQGLYVEKAVSRERGEFARVLIIHALLHRMWEVGHYLSDPLSYWEPVAARQNINDVLPEDVWLPANKTFTKWQNSTCDALDVLHWQANSTIALANGFEHPTILHLHIARIVCLVPYTEIVSLARHVAENNGPDHDVLVDPSTQRGIVSIQRWTAEHQYKARLSVIHAGAILWHLRRFSTDAFYEAPAVALATLTLWAFGVFSNKRGQARHVNDIPPGEGSRDGVTGTRSANKRKGNIGERGEDLVEESNDDGCPDMILLDRPADDELVQQFIRSGDSMEARLSGVGDIFAAKGPELVLREGSKLLESDKSVCSGFETWRTLMARLAAQWKLRSSGMCHSM
jgi:hypothetical protein